MKGWYLLFVLYPHVPSYWSVASFSSVPQGHHHFLDTDPDLDREKFFFTDKQASVDLESHQQGNNRRRRRRRRFSVEYVPAHARPRTPGHSPTERVLEIAQVPMVNIMERPVAPKSATGFTIDPFILLASAAGGLWTVTPIVYWHCLHQNILHLFPLMIMAAALEVTVMLGLIVAHHGHAKPAVALFAALRVGAAYLISEPLNFPLEIVEGLVLFASSILLMETLSSHDNKMNPSP